MAPWQRLPRSGLRSSTATCSGLAGPFVFGLSAFTLIFAATEILNIGRLVSNDHAPLWAALAVFLWSLPADVVLVIPMALLLGTLLAVQRLSGESELTAMTGGGHHLRAHRHAAARGGHRDVARDALSRKRASCPMPTTSSPRSKTSSSIT